MFLSLQCLSFFSLQTRFLCVLAHMTEYSCPTTPKLYSSFPVTQRETHRVWVPVPQVWSSVHSAQSSELCRRCRILTNMTAYDSWYLWISRYQKCLHTHCIIFTIPYKVGNSFWWIWNPERLNNIPMIAQHVSCGPRT